MVSRIKLNLKIPVSGEILYTKVFIISPLKKCQQFDQKLILYDLIKSIYFYTITIWLSGFEFHTGIFLSS